MGSSPISLWMSAGAAVLLCAAMVALAEAGRRVGVRHMARDADGARPGVGAVDAAVFALLGLLIGFTFAGAASRFDARRSLVTEEANAIGTAWLRLDLLSAESQPAMRVLFRQYLDSRLETYQKVPDIQAVEAELARSERLQLQIWEQAVVGVREPTAMPAAAMLLLPALNQMIDITTTRLMAVRIHPPFVVFVMLGTLALVSALLAGYGMAAGKKRSWMHVVAFATVIAATVYVIVDMEFPRLGLIRVDAVDQVLRDLRQSMN